MIWGLLAGLGAAVCYGVPAALQAVAARRLPDGTTLEVVVAAVRDPLMVSVVVCYGVGFGLHLVAIALLPLYLAQSVIAASLVFTALAAVRLLGEWPHPLQWVALGGVVVGLALLAASAGHPGHVVTGTAFVVVLYVAWVVLVVLALLTRGATGNAAGVLLGTLSGLAYAGTPLATRALEHARIDTRTVLTAVVLALFGVLGFVLEALAVQRVRVTVAATPLIVAQTVVPALVGLLVLHDGIRPGWTAGVVLGLLVSLAGAVGLAGVEAPAEVGGAAADPLPTTGWMEP